MSKNAAWVQIPSSAPSTPKSSKWWFWGILFAIFVLNPEMPLFDQNGLKMYGNELRGTHGGTQKNAPPEWSGRAIFSKIFEIICNC